MKTCRYCRRKFKTEKAMNSHVGKMHKGDESKRLFKPTHKQFKLVRVMADPTTKPTITAWCRKTGIARKTYYSWFKDVEFVTWFNKAWAEAMEKTQPYLDNVGLRKSVKDLRYWEAMQMKYHKFGRVTEERKSLQEVTDDELDQIDKKYGIRKRLNNIRKDKKNKVSPAK